MTTTFAALPPADGLLVSANPGPDLAAAGYREDEYVVRGSAWRYAADSWPEDGRIDATAVDEAAFSTRVVVRRPAASGPAVLVVEWLNVSSGDDAAPDWTYLAEEIVRRGHVWVGISAQHMGVEGGRAVVPTEGELARTRPPSANGLKNRQPDRYADLSHPGDAYCYGIISTITAALQDPGLDQPLNDVGIERTLLVGESQSAYALTTYLNAVQPLTSTFDGALVHSRGSAAMPLGEVGESVDLDRVRHLQTVRLRDDLAIPVIVVQTETDVISNRFHFWQARQPDHDRLRVWEVAGTAHADRWQIWDYESLLGCADPVNAGQQVYVLRAALRWLETWAAGGPPPPSAAPLEIEPGAENPDRPLLVVDEIGIARGGVRVPAVEVPAQLLTGVALPDASIICHLFGRTLAVPEDLLRARYAGPDDYRELYAAAVRAAVDDGFVLAEDADAVLADARPDLIPG